MGRAAGMAARGTAMIVTAYKKDNSDKKLARGIAIGLGVLLIGSILASEATSLKGTRSAPSPTHPTAASRGDRTSKGAVSSASTE